MIEEAPQRVLKNASKFVGHIHRMLHVITRNSELIL